MTKEYDAVVAVNTIYAENYDNWKYLQRSYLGGVAYKAGKYLTKYANEDDEQYDARIQATMLDNQCNSIVSVYNSFLFREPPTRDFGSIEKLPETEAFLKDADLDGRSLNNFKKEVSVWSTVFGHCWELLVKPNTNANTRADELAQKVRPYVSLLTPLVVIDWRYERQANGAYVLTNFKYIEEVNGYIQTIKLWTTDDEGVHIIVTFTVNTDKEEVIDTQIEINGIGKIPAIVAYNKRAARGLGISDIADIADAQKYMYNLYSEGEQSVRIDSHDSIVKTENTDANAGAGSFVIMPDDMEPSLKPYALGMSGANLVNINNTKDKVIEAIDNMANTGAVRATEAKVMSGVAQQQEFELLNARLSDKADNLELAEENMWRLFAMYLGKAWDGEITYAGSFNIQDVHNEYVQLKTAKEAATDPKVLAEIDKKILVLLGVDEGTVNVTVQNNSDSVE